MSQAEWQEPPLPPKLPQDLTATVPAGSRRRSLRSPMTGYIRTEENQMTALPKRSPVLTASSEARKSLRGDRGLLSTRLEPTMQAFQRLVRLAPPARFAVPDAA
jgi:hypothetical protein